MAAPGPDHDPTRRLAPCLAIAAYLLLLLPLAGCQSARAPVPIDVSGPPTPASYEGVLPCADCDGIRTFLHLRADRVFVLEQDWLEQGEPTRSLVALGRWSVRADGQGLVLAGGPLLTRQFRIESHERLRMLDRLGESLAAGDDYDLVQVATRDPLYASMALRGTYVHVGGDGSFTECQSGLQVPLAGSGEGVALARAYIDARPGPGEPLMVALQGHLEPRAMSSDGSEVEALVVDAFERAWRGESCEAQSPAVAAGLEDTEWLLLEIDGVRVAVPEHLPRARIRLVPGNQRLEGWGGCNVVFASYQVAGESLEFDQVSSTSLSCTYAERETRLLARLGAVTGYVVANGTLTLLADDVPTLRFEASQPYGP